MRQCRIAGSCKILYHPCCVDCKERACTNRCQNSPERCGCWDYFGPTQKAPSPLKGRTKINQEDLLRLHKQGLL